MKLELWIKLAILIGAPPCKHYKVVPHSWLSWFGVTRLLSWIIMGTTWIFSWFCCPSGSFAFLGNPPIHCIIHIYIYIYKSYSIYIIYIWCFFSWAIMRKSAGPSSAVPRISTGRRESRLRGLGAFTIKKGGWTCLTDLTTKNGDIIDISWYTAIH